MNLSKILTISMVGILNLPSLGQTNFEPQVAQPGVQMSDYNELVGNTNMVPLDFRLPIPPMGSAVVDLKLDDHVAPRSTHPRPLILVPRGTTNLAFGGIVTSSDRIPLEGDLQQIVHGVEQHNGGGKPLSLHPGVQWVQVDLGKSYPLHAIVVWHSYWPPNIVRGVIVQVSEDEAFHKNAETLFNNDHRNLVGFGVGKDKEYFESFEGNLLQVHGTRARYVRLYSVGSSAGPENVYTAVAVYGMP